MDTRLLFLREESMAAEAVQRLGDSLRQLDKSLRYTTTSTSKHNRARKERFEARQRKKRKKRKNK